MRVLDRVPPQFRRVLGKIFGLALLAFFFAPSALAQLNWEGQTGGLITPFAYTELSPRHGFGHPELAFHYMNAGPALGNEFQASVTIGFLKIAEIGFTRSFNQQGSVPGVSAVFANGFNISHIKFRLLPENARKARFVPAVAAGAVVRTQVRRVTEVPERENTTCTDFYVVATKTLDQLKLPIVLNAGIKLTNASLMGIAGNSPDWSFRGFGAIAFRISGPAHSKLDLGAEVAQQPRSLKEVPGQYFSTTATIPTTLAYFVRVHPSSDVPITAQFGIAQLAGKIGPAMDLQARHALVVGVSYRF
ncbi:MAG TPA: DUF3034 family protein [Candidatus Sulfotelmatobacter sp.]|nr:DUF3034 family protein [Candidatus Sulfotelmatobacter sp.]